MEFEDEHDEEQEEEEEDDDQEINVPPPSLITPPSYDSLGGGPTRPGVNPDRRSGVVRYRECLKNHAVNIGGHALDGCGEFMPAGDEGTLNALKCAACTCHRNFHRKEIHAVPSPGGPFPPQFSAYYRSPGPPPSGYLHVSSAAPQHRQLAVVPSTSHSGEMDDGGKKRFRTKFTAEQKDKMLEFAEKLGWRIQKHDDVAIQRFCDELQIRRQVLKVWMHNNKLTHAKKP